MVSVSRRTPCDFAGAADEERDPKHDSGPEADQPCVVIEDDILRWIHRLVKLGGQRQPPWNCHSRRRIEGGLCTVLCMCACGRARVCAWVCAWVCACIVLCTARAEPMKESWMKPSPSSRSAKTFSLEAATGEGQGHVPRRSRQRRWSQRGAKGLLARRHRGQCSRGQVRSGQVATMTPDGCSGVA